MTSKLGLAMGIALAALVSGGGHAQDLERGRAIYAMRCVGCHNSSVHKRESRKAQDFVAVRAAVARFSAEAGGTWQPDEIDDVAAYLNRLYYRYPCPPDVCRSAKQAALSR
jgi:mono/diheme cytochrome c family protein